MEKYKNKFNLPESLRKTIGVWKKFFFATGLFLLAGTQAFSQNKTAMSRDALLNYWVGGGIALLFLLIFFIGLRKAILILNENGKSVEFTFPVFREMTQNTKAVAIIFFIVILSAIFWAITVGS